MLLSSTLIDSIFISPINKFSISGNITVAISDHLPQFLILNTEAKSKHKPQLPFRRNWSKLDKDAFKDKFEKVDWNRLLDIEKGDVESTFNSFLSSFSSLYDKHVPLKQLTRRQTDLLLKPWITEGIVTSMTIRDNYFRDYLNTSSPDLKSFLHGKYKFYCDRIVSLIRLSKKLHYSRYFLENSNNLRKLRQGVREIMSFKSSSSSNCSISLNINGSLLQNRKKTTRQ